MKAAEHQSEALEHRKLFLSKKSLKVCHSALRYCYSLIRYIKDSPVHVPRKQLPTITEELKNTGIEAKLDIKTILHTAHCLLENAAYGPRLGITAQLLHYFMRTL